MKLAFLFSTNAVIPSFRSSWGKGNKAELDVTCPGGSGAGLSTRTGRGTGRVLQQDHLETCEWSGFPDRVGLAWEWVFLHTSSPHAQVMLTQEPRTSVSNKLSSTENLRLTLFGSFTKSPSEFSSTLGVMRQESRLYLCLFSCVYTCVYTHLHVLKSQSHFLSFFHKKPIYDLLIIKEVNLY